MVNTTGDFPKAAGDTIWQGDTNKAFGLYTGTQVINVNVTNVDGSTSYSTQCNFHAIRNIGTTKCYVNFDATATTASYPLNPNEEQFFYGISTAIHSITASSTTTLRVRGYGTTAVSNSMLVGQIVCGAITNVSFSLTANSNIALIKNDSANDAFYDINTSAATATATLIKAGEVRMESIVGMNTIQGLSKTAGTTATLCIVGAVGF